MTRQFFDPVSGYGWAATVEILCTALQSGPWGEDICGVDRATGKPKPMPLGHFFLAIDIEKICPVNTFEKNGKFHINCSHGFPARVLIQNLSSWRVSSGLEGESESSYRTRKDMDCGRTRERRARGEDCTGWNEGECSIAEEYAIFERQETGVEEEVWKVAF